MTWLVATNDSYFWALFFFCGCSTGGGEVRGVIVILLCITTASCYESKEVNVVLVRDGGDGTGTTACWPFTVNLPADTPVTRLWFWPAVGSAVLDIPVSAGGSFSSPNDACSATVDYPERWTSWTSSPRTFPAGAPQGTASLSYPGLGTVPFCELPVGEAAWGVTHDGVCK